MVYKSNNPDGGTNHCTFSIIRLLVDAAFAGIGFAFGGVVGAGTLVCIALVGPVAGVFLPINEKLVNKTITSIIEN